MLTKKQVGSHTLFKKRSQWFSARQGYRPNHKEDWFVPTSKEAFATTTTVWRVDELIRRRVRDWRRLTGETGHDGTRAETMRRDHDSVYTGTSSVFPAPLMEYIILRYGGPVGSKILDAFAGGPPRAVVSSLMGMEYHGVELRQEQIDENEKELKALGLTGYHYYQTDGRFLDGLPEGYFDCAITCPPYWYLEKYSDDPNDLSNLGSYDEFNAGMFLSALSHFPLMRPGAFVCIVVGPFRDKRTGELIDFPGHTVDNFREAGFTYWQQIVLSKNFASAAKRSTTSWKGEKLVPNHEFLLVFRKPEADNGKKEGKDRGG